MITETRFTPGPFGEPMDKLCRQVGGWSEDQMAYAVEVIGNGKNPQILVTGSKASWMPRAKRWNFTGHKPVSAVIRLDDYRAAIAARGESTPC